MAWDEWEQLKAAAVERSSAQMQLNHVPDDPGGGTGTLVSHRPVWSKAGQDVGSLREGIDKALTALSDGQEGLGADFGCQTASAQKLVHDSWQRYVKDMRGRCEKLADLLQGAGSALLRTDESIMVEVGNLKVEYGDTPAVGGQDEGR
ncbi:hypothetical protein ABZT04_06525 [Streptomyces sp. NPDC005492]|uniref:hypothetical protein n=1 Tax=Streptomyces sp. NPDC005492 TaxID=3156883 RepID=UPI0033A1D043